MTAVRHHDHSPGDSTVTHTNKVRVQPRRYALFVYDFHPGALKRTGLLTYEMFILSALARVVAVVASTMSSSPEVARELTGKDVPAVPMDEATQNLLKDKVAEVLGPVYQLIDVYLARLREKAVPVNSLRASGTSFDYKTASRSKEMTALAHWCACSDPDDGLALTRVCRRLENELTIAGEPGSAARREQVHKLVLEIEELDRRSGKAHKLKKQAARKMHGELKVAQPCADEWREILYSVPNRKTGDGKTYTCFFAGCATAINTNGNVESLAAARDELDELREYAFVRAEPSAAARAYTLFKKAEAVLPSLN